MALRPSVVYSEISVATPGSSATSSFAAAFCTMVSMCFGVSGSK